MQEKAEHEEDEKLLQNLKEHCEHVVSKKKIEDESSLKIKDEINEMRLKVSNSIDTCHYRN
jgi:hypothetical protein